MNERLNAALKGRYRVEREIGAGGMATLYLAHDIRHDRRVALKLLRAEVAAVVGAKRFLAEIRTTANLQHPHILPLFDSGEADGFLFYTMPYIEGETLRDRLQRERQLPIDEAIRIAAEVGDALDYAHRHGVIHRDVKPANILLHEGRPLVADFGIALAVTTAAEGRITETGLSLGTAHYMSPEQAVGDRSVDSRTDIYALACVAYETLAGQPPFTGPTAQAVLAQVLTAEPRPVTELRRTTPPHVEAALAIALQKLPADRFPDARSFANALRDPSAVRPLPASASSSGHEQGAARGPARSINRVSLALNGVLLLAIIGLAGQALRSDVPAPSPWVTRIQLQTGVGVQRGPPALSPDGRYFAWPREDGIHIRSLDQLDDRLIPGTAGGSSIFFSPDSRHLGFSTGLGFQLRTVPVAGGPIRTLADSALLGVWAEDGWVYFYRASADGRPRIARVPESGGPREVVLPMDTTRIFAPTAALPPGRGILGTVAHPRGPADSAESHVGVLDPAAGNVKILLPGRTPWYEPQTRHIVFLRESTLMAAPYDADRTEVTGTPFPVADGISGFGLAGDGTLWAALGPLTFAIPVLLDRQGLRTELMPELTLDDVFFDAFFSPDGQRLTLELRAADSDRSDIWVYDLPDGPRTRLTHDGGSFPAWTLDDRFVLFARADGVYRVRADASAPPERVLRADAIQRVQPVPGGGIVFERNNGNDFDVGFAPLDTDEQFVTLLDGAANEKGPAVSPDGRWLAYESDESGRPEVYVMPFGKPGRGRLISVTGGDGPSFSWNGHEIFFVNANREFEVVRFRGESDFESVERSVLFDASPFAGRFQPAPGDSVFIAKRPGGTRTNAPIILVRNWVRELITLAAEARR